MNTDPIADMLSRIRNATLIGAATTTMPTSKIKRAIANLLVTTGYLSHSEVQAEENSQKTQLVLTLKYYAGQPVIHGLKQISTPGHRVYRSINRLTNRPVSKIEDFVISTPKGLMTLTTAQKARLGGEVLFKIW